MGRKKFSIRKRWLEKIEKNNLTIDPNTKKEKKCPAYVLKYNSNSGKTGYSFNDSK